MANIRNNEYLFKNATQLRTWISDNQGDLTIKSDTGQHLQFDVFLEDVCSTIYRPAVWSVLGCCKEFIGPAVEYQGDQARLCYKGKPKLTLLSVENTQMGHWELSSYFGICFGF